MPPDGCNDLGPVSISTGVEPKSSDATAIFFGIISDHDVGIGSFDSPVQARTLDVGISKIVGENFVSPRDPVDPLSHRRCAPVHLSKLLTDGRSVVHEVASGVETHCVGGMVEGAGFSVLQHWRSLYVHIGYDFHVYFLHFVQEPSKDVDVLVALETYELAFPIFWIVSFGVHVFGRHGLHSELFENWMGSEVPVSRRAAGQTENDIGDRFVFQLTGNFLGIKPVRASVGAAGDVKADTLLARHPVRAGLGLLELSFDGAPHSLLGKYKAH
mmetsp:Transcript_20288/g.46029  ORF Transcript_20288/g.46029 Transcript_20288/m.46029 type:complete len:271 (+) Transcript_20288:1140-1952(+)